MRDYTEVPIFRRMVNIMVEMLAAKPERAARVPNVVTQQWDATKLRE